MCLKHSSLRQSQERTLKKNELTVVHGDKVSDARTARGCIGAQLNKTLDTCRLDARIASLKPTAELDGLLNRLGELLVKEFPNDLKAVTIDTDDTLVAWVVIPGSSTRGGPHKQIARLQEVLKGAGFSGTFIGSVVIKKKSGKQKNH